MFKKNSIRLKQIIQRGQIIGEISKKFAGCFN